MRIGSESNPVDSKEPIKLARALIKSLFTTQKGSTLHYFYGSFWQWEKGQWLLRDEEWISSICTLWLEDCYFATRLVNSTSIRRLAPGRQKIIEIISFVKDITILRGQIPLFLSNGQPSPVEIPEKSIAFSNALIDINQSTRDKVVSYDKDERWFDIGCLPFPYDPDAKCPRWLQALGEWSNDDPEWKILLQRWMGYCLMAYRDYDRWMLLHGKRRGGKGCIDRVLKQLMGNREVFISTDLRSLASKHGAQGLQFCRVLSITEVERLDSSDGQRVASLLKNIVGRDDITIDEKYIRLYRNVRVSAAVMMCANQIPILPDAGQGVSSKMLMLPFDTTWINREDHSLEPTLTKELPGIALWAIQGAIDIIHEPDPSRKFPLSPRSIEAIELYKLHNNPFDAFLLEHFSPDTSSFVPHSMYWDLWLKFCKRHRVQQTVQRFKLTHCLSEESTWDLRAGRNIRGGPRGLFGLAILKKRND